jgi:hypothetical protein
MNRVFAVILCSCAHNPCFNDKQCRYGSIAGNIEPWRIYSLSTAAGSMWD